MAVSEDFKTPVLGRVYSLDALYKDKIAALSGRDEPRDYFDLWYICQLKKIPFEPGKKPDKKRYRQVLGRYLPRKYLKALDEIL
jgi:predicted nucleotidyltransferase component of viral defense system